MLRAVLRGRNDDGPAQHLVVSPVAQPPVPDAVAHEPWPPKVGNLDVVADKCEALAKHIKGRDRADHRQQQDVRPVASDTGGATTCVTVLR